MLEEATSPYEILDASSNSHTAVLYAASEKAGAKRFFKQSRYNHVDAIFVRPLSAKGSEHLGLRFDRRRVHQATTSINDTGDNDMQAISRTRKKPSLNGTGRARPGVPPLKPYRVCAPQVMYHDDEYSSRSLILAGRHLHAFAETPKGAAEQFAELLPDWPIVIVREMPDLYDPLRTPKPGARNRTWNTRDWRGYEILRDYEGRLAEIRLLEIDEQGFQRWDGPYEEDDEHVPSETPEERVNRAMLEAKLATERQQREEAERKQAAQQALDAFGPVIHHKDGPVV